MTLHNEDRELQIRLAELQADVQINLTIAFGFFAGFVAFMIGFEQIYFSLSSENTLMKSIIFVFIALAGIACFISVTYFAGKAQDARKQMEELRKRYVW